MVCAQHMLKKKEDEVKRLRSGLIEKERFLMEQDKLNESLSKELLSNSMDNTARIWDVRPFVAGGERQTMQLQGHNHGFEKLLLKSSWSPDGTLVGLGSSDCMVCVFDATSGSIKYRLPGHGGSVNEVAFHPKEPILGSCSSDRSVYLGEVDLQWDSSGAGLGGLAGEKLN